MTNTLENRLQPLDILSQEEPDFLYSRQLVLNQEARARNLYEKTCIVPTIGCEVEVNWSTLFPDLAEKYFGPRQADGTAAKSYSDLSLQHQVELDATTRLLDAEVMPRYEATKQAGIPKGGDAYWEFAQSPTFAWQTLATETRLLMHQKLIPEGYDHSLHVTLGNLALGNGGMYLLLAGLELGGSSAERIRHATQPGADGGGRGWAKRACHDGLRTRHRRALDFGQEIGCEMRSLVARDQLQVSSTLRTAQMLGASLLAYRKRNQIEAALHQEIAAYWPAFRGIIHFLLKERHLPPDRPWGRPYENQKVWLGWAACLEATADPRSLESEILHLIQLQADGIEQTLISAELTSAG